MKITIRKPDIKDLPKLITLWQQQYEYHHDLDSQYYVSNSEELNKKFQSYLTKAIKENAPYILIAKDDNKMIGFITYEKVDADYFDTNFKEHSDILELFVKEDYREKGVGKLLMDKVEKFFKNKGINTLSLQCSTFNKNALSFYKHLGLVNRQTLLYKKI